MGRGRVVAVVGVLLSLLAGDGRAAPPRRAGTPKPSAAEPPPLAALDPTAVRTLRGHKKDVWRVAFHPTEPVLVSCGDDGQIVLWDALSGEKRGELDHPDFVHAIAFDAEGGLFVSASQTPYGPAFSGSLIVRNTKTDEQVAFPSGAGWCFKGAAVSPDGHYVAAGGEDRALRVWDLRALKSGAGPKQRGQQKKEAEISPPAPALPKAVWCVAFHPTEAVVAAGCGDGSVRLFTVGRGGVTPLKTSPEGHGKGVTCVAFSPDGRSLVSTSHDGTAQLWDVRTGKRGRTFRASDASVEWACFDPQGRMLATAQADKKVKLWEVATGTELKVLEGHDQAVMGVAFSPDGTRLATASKDFTVKVWDLFQPQQAPKGDKKRQ